MDDLKTIEDPTYTLGDTVARLEFALRLRRDLAAAIRERLEKEQISMNYTGITGPSSDIVLYLGANVLEQTVFPVKELQYVAGCSRTATLNVLGKLERAGIVERRKDTNDRRVTGIRLTGEFQLRLFQLVDRL
jgi:DNA-binding MarR family transcriptional regulator